MHALVVRGGTLVTPTDIFVADIGIDDGVITAWGGRLAGRRTLDADGLLVIPGAVDPHVHLEMPVGPTQSSDDWATGTRAAAVGGTTTLIDFVEADLGAALLGALAARRAQADGRAVIDYGLHMTLREMTPATLAEIPAVVAAGCPSFKTYLTYAGFYLDDSTFIQALEAVGKAGGLVLVHAENHGLVEHLRRRLPAEGHTGPRYHALSRPVAAEAEAIERATALAEATGCPLYVVHVSTARGAAAVARARARGQTVYGETCPQYLLLTEAELDRPGFEGAKFVCSPPLRPAGNGEALWAGLAASSLQTVGTDHCPFFYQGQKELGREVFTGIPNGLPGIETRLALLHTFGVGAGRLSLNQWVQVCCANPARIFGLYPRKGTLVPGADADIVLFDPQATVTLTKDRLHENVDYTPYAGLTLRGYPHLTLARGEVIAAEGNYVGPAGGGRFLARPL
ncbi:MAG: dihydropyrimidinase [Anaerolineales bacterium]|nr:dihydropyrimidinase [Anaerolineales bacterium]